MLIKNAEIPESKARALNKKVYNNINIWFRHLIFLLITSTILLDASPSPKGFPVNLSIIES